MLSVLPRPAVGGPADVMPDQAGGQAQRPLMNASIGDQSSWWLFPVAVLVRCLGSRSVPAVLIVVGFNTITTSNLLI